MAFFGRVGSILRQTVSKQIINGEVSASISKPSIYQAIRWFSSIPSSKLFIGGISYSTDELQLREAFGKYGQVIDARIIVDRETGRSRGFGFITYTSSEEASCAIQALDGQPLHGRNIRVNYANDRTPRGGGGYNRDFGNNFGGNFGGGNYGSSDGNYAGYGSNTGTANSYGSQGNYGSGSYGPGDGFGTDGSYAGGNAYGGVGPDTGGSYNNAGGGFEEGADLGYGNANQFGTTGNSNMDGVAGTDNQIDVEERDDVGDDNHLEKRA
ncbi:hypothetical protein SLEP1_g6410 [Rubroshorea leprosula]|uniref:RRM domain-containing protein n=1 Tax=Rubroshorea leprosula TaxID=152421 RepID=A0AAV5HVF4_9ROSI|nr:hypothetical protein SLEP1_g6410 [Rubroshorea leprosula]